MFTLVSHCYLAAKILGKTPYYGLMGRLTERGAFFMIQVYQRVAILQVEIYESFMKSVIVKIAIIKNISLRDAAYFYINTLISNYT